MEITDTMHKKQLTCSPVKKEATLSEVAVASYGPHGPFEWVQKEMKKPTCSGWKTKDRAGEVNVFRHSYQRREQRTRLEL